jgi:hypothetical protein
VSSPFKQLGSTKGKAVEIEAEGGYVQRVEEGIVEVHAPDLGGRFAGAIVGRRCRRRV